MNDLRAPPVVPGPAGTEREGPSPYATGLDRDFYAYDFRRPYAAYPFPPFMGEPLLNEPFPAPPFPSEAMEGVTPWPGGQAYGSLYGNSYGAYELYRERGNAPRPSASYYP